jgi:hypothetical protein
MKKAGPSILQGYQLQLFVETLFIARELQSTLNVHSRPNQVTPWRRAFLEKFIVAKLLNELSLL